MLSTGLCAYAGMGCATGLMAAADSGKRRLGAASIRNALTASIAWPAYLMVYLLDRGNPDLH